MKYLFRDPKDNSPSRKSTYAFLSFFVAVGISVMGLFKVVDTSLITELVTAFLVLFGALMGLTVANKAIK